MLRNVLAVLLTMLALGASAHAQFSTSTLPASAPGGGQVAPNLYPAPGACFQPLLYESPYDTSYFSADVVAFRRDWQTPRTMATLGTPTNAVLRTNDLEFVNQPGLRLLAGRRLNNVFAAEVGFVGLLQWDETRPLHNFALNSQGTAGNLFSPLSGFGQPAQVGLDYNTLVSIRTATDFNTAEFNIRQRFDTPPTLMQVSGLYGFRYFNIHERFEYRARSLSPTPVGTDNAVDVVTKNGLFGLQVGGTLEFRIEQRGWLNFEAKGIMCQNSASEETQYTVGPIGLPGAPVHSQQAKGRVAFGGDVAGSMVWKFTPAIVGRIGYQGIFLDGLALAADNFARNAPFLIGGPTEVFRNGHLAFHGPFAGLTATW